MSNEQKTWKREDIYRVVETTDLQRKFLNPVPPRLSRLLIGELRAYWENTTLPMPEHNYTDAFVDLILSETDWIESEGEETLIPPDRVIDVVTGKIPCPVCKDNDRRLYRNLHTGQDTWFQAFFSKPCPCGFARRHWSLWGDTQLVPLRFAEAFFSTLARSK
jgi:hypothetical protein